MTSHGNKSTRNTLDFDQSNAYSSRFIFLSLFCLYVIYRVTAASIDGHLSVLAACHCTYYAIVIA